MTTLLEAWAGRYGEMLYFYVYVSRVLCCLLDLGNGGVERLEGWWDGREESRNAGRDGPIDGGNKVKKDHGGG